MDGTDQLELPPYSEHRPLAHNAEQNTAGPVSQGTWQYPVSSQEQPLLSPSSVVTPKMS